MLTLIFGVTIVTTRSLSPYNQAQAETLDLAERRADLVEANEFYWFNGAETYFTITGQDSEGNSIIVIVKQDTGEIEVLQEDETISKQTAINTTHQQEEPEEILEARIGIDKDEPVWEVTFRQENGRMGYTYISLTSGEWIRTIKNI